MRLPFPERIPFKTVFSFAVALCVVQLVEGTDATFALCCVFFILIAGIAFNTAGGMTRASGVYIFSFAVLAVIVGLVWKAVLGEPGDSNLEAPLLTMYLYVVGISMMLIAVYLSRRVTLRRAILGDILPDHKIQTATIGCTITAFLITAMSFFAPGGNGSVVAALNQLNHFFPLAIILGVTHTIRRTGGRRSLSTPVVLSAALLFYSGVVGFSKEGMIAPFVCYLLAAASQQFRVSRLQILLFVLGTIFLFRYLVPYSQYGRNFRDENSQFGQVKVVYSLLTNLGQVRQDYVNSTAEVYSDQLYTYFNSPQGFFDRLQMISMDDALNQRTAQFGAFGIYPVIQGFQNVVPHFIWKDKPSYVWGNVFAHEIGMLAPEDNSTGVSFSPVATAFHIDGWIGIIFVAPALWLVLFWVSDSLCGDLRKAPWGLLLALAFAHFAPEGDLGIVIYMFSTGAFFIVVASLLAAYLMPIIGTLFIGPEGVFLKQRSQVRSMPGRLLPARRAQSQPSAT